MDSRRPNRPRPGFDRTFPAAAALVLVGSLFSGVPAAEGTGSGPAARSAIVDRQRVHPLREEGRPAPTSARTPHGESAPAGRRPEAHRSPGGTSRSDIRSGGPPARAGLSQSTSFVGLDYHDSGGFFPPDTQIARSSSRVLEAVNGGVRLFKDSGSVLDTMELGDFFGAVRKPQRSDFLYDPKVTFDANGSDERMYAIALQQFRTGGTTGKAAIWLAISRASEPRNLSSESWCRYRIDARSDVGTKLAGWADFPGLGIGADTVAVTSNQYTFKGSRFTYANVRVFDKLAAAENGHDCPTFDVATLQPSGKLRNYNAFTLQPAQHATDPTPVPGAGDPLYLVNTSMGDLPSSLYRVWRITGGAGAKPEITHVNLAGPNYNLPSKAPQRGTFVPVDTGDVEILQVVGRGDELVATHTVRCSFRRSTPRESCVRILHITVGADHSGALKASLSARVTTFGGGDGWFYFEPSVAMNEEGTVAVSLQTSSAKTYLSAAWTTEDATDVAKIARGTCPDTAEYDSGFQAVRTGDYTSVQTDPSTGGFWFAGERAAETSGRCHWQTRIVRTTP
jgi:hypothetical protein